MKLRPYQHDAVEAAIDSLEGDAMSALVVMPTGTGKTIMFAHVAKHMAGRIMVLAHREELIWQAAHKIEAVTGVHPDIEMAEMNASPGIFDRSRIVVSSVQTQIAGERGRGRMTRFRPDEFGLVIVDEAHHCAATSYRRVINHYRQNPGCKLLGVTATPDRHDEKALGQIFETVAYDYEISDAIRDGWLVPIEQRAVHVEGLDYSSIRTTAGDLNGADLARVMEYEETLHQIASPTMEIVGDRKALVFAASVAHAERLCEIFNRHRPGCAHWLCGKTPKEERRQMIKDFAENRFQILCNVGVATEGFDDPSIDVVVMARPTKSRALYAQMAGRGTRPLPGIVDEDTEADARRLAIATSGKPKVEVVDFVGNAGRHALISTADILGGKYEEKAIERAKEHVEKAGAKGEQLDMLDELDRAQQEIEQEAERERRRKLRLKARYSTSAVDPFATLGIRPWKERGWDKGRQPSEKMLSLLERNGVATRGLSFGQARQLIQEIVGRRESKKATYKQANLLRRFGEDASEMSFQEATQRIDAIAKNGWKRPNPLAQEAVLDCANS